LVAGSLRIIEEEEKEEEEGEEEEEEGTESKLCKRSSLPFVSAPSKEVPCFFSIDEADETTTTEEEVMLVSSSIEVLLPMLLRNISTILFEGL